LAGNQISQATPVVCGIRAEDISIVPADKLSANHTQGTVDLVESLGSDVYVSFNIGAHMLLARASPDLPLQESQQIPVDLNLSKMHFFDPDSGINLLGLV
jgi:multiple sugar transport system ATP-binding protein